MNTPLVRSGSVGMPTYTGDEGEPVPDPSPGNNSVWWDGTIGPTKTEDERREHWGLPPLPLMAQVTPAAAAAAAPRPAQPATPDPATPRAPAAATATPAPPVTRRP